MVEKLQDVELFFMNRRKFGIQPGLERMERMLQLLGNPEKQLRFIHVAGTNGKGSTVQFITNALIENNYRVGVFTSPSFSGFTGHFFINNRSIDDETFNYLINKIYPFVQQLDEEGVHLSEFEILTTLAFLYFENQVDFVILEAGMGGRFDSTNCIDPLISIITTVAIDHEGFLGKTLAEISNHKAGIIKQNRPVIIGEMAEEAKEVILKETIAKNTTLYEIDKNFTVYPYKDTFIWSCGVEKISFQLQMKGKHQINNAALAIMALNELKITYHFHIDWEKCIQALESTSLPGRFEVLTNQPRIILDSAHNVQGINSFINTAKQMVNPNDTKLLFSAFKDKQKEEMLTLLQEANFNIFVTTFEHERATTMEEWKTMIHNPAIQQIEDWQQVIHELHPEETLFVTGSLHFVATVRTYLLKNSENK